MSKKYIHFSLAACILLFTNYIHSAQLDSRAQNSSLRVKTVTAKGIYLFNGFLAEVVNPIAGISSNSFEHWWIEIETEKPDTWFVLQFGGKQNDGKHVELSAVSSEACANDRGCFFRRDADPKIFTHKKFKPHCLTMGQVYDWARNHPSNIMLSHIIARI